jgi:hypothetical protein
MKSIIVAITLTLSTFGAFASDVDFVENICQVDLKSELMNSKALARSEAENSFASSWEIFSADWDAAWNERSTAWINAQKAVCEK